jgi:cell division protein FtsI (penicillin-binding protein 3)
VLTKSSNIGAAKIAVICGPRVMADYLKRFGLGEKTNLGLPGESRGILRPLERWSPSSHEYMAFGHELAATPVQLARAVSVVANGGNLVTPFLVESLETADAASGQASIARPGRAAPRRVLSAATALEMRKLMQEVVEAGTGRLAKIPGYTAGGKTGTAELIDPRTHQYLENKNAASFLGFAPVADPRVVVVATVYGTSAKGGPAAGPVFSRVAQTALRVLNVPQDKDLLLAAGRAPVETPAATAAPPAEATFPLEADLPPLASPADLVGPRVPDFRGKPFATVLRMSASLGLPVETAGRGRAARQRPAPGSILPVGERVYVVFDRD